MNRIFVSYAHIDPDRQVAQRLYGALGEAGLRPWMDEFDLEPGVDWAARIGEEIRTCQYMLALFSRESLRKRGFVQREIRLALDILDSVPIDGRFLIPIRLNDCRPTEPRIAKLHWLDFFPSYDRGVQRLLASLRATERAPARLYVDAGVEVPRDIGVWEDERLHPYIRAVLEPEARERARRDYKGVAVRDLPSAINVRVQEKLEDAAQRHGFVEGWRRYRSRTKVT